MKWILLLSFAAHAGPATTISEQVFDTRAQCIHAEAQAKQPGLVAKCEVLRIVKVKVKK